MKNPKEKCKSPRAILLNTNVTDCKKNKIQNCPRRLIFVKQYSCLFSITDHKYISLIKVQELKSHSKTDG